jgi:hypothetical protein
MLDLVAPGLMIGVAGTSMSGTSQAAAHVAGAAAVLQSAHIEAEGVPMEPRWVQRMLKISAAALPYTGLVLGQLNLSTDPYWSYIRDAKYYNRESAEASIPAAPASYESVIGIAEQGYDVAGVYLYLEIIHPSPEDVEVTVTEPDGSSLTVTLPGGTSNFNGVIGKEHLPGAFDAFNGNADGDWLVSLSDTVEGHRGYYIATSLILIESTCSSNCETEGCGHDFCAGSCGTCPGDDRCTWEGVCVSCVPDCDQKTCGDNGCGGSCGSCEDGLFCDGEETCVGGSCSSLEIPCADSVCDESLDRCVECLVDSDCDDNNVCNGIETCIPAISCRAGSALVCDDAAYCNGAESCDPVAGCQGGTDPCAGGLCDEGLDQCVNCLGDLDCDDGNLCNGTETCGPSGDCQAGSPLVCDDAAYCNGAESCDPVTGCQAGTDPCSSDLCDDGLDQCVECLSELDCDDGNVCNGIETCNPSGACQVGIPFVCDDGAYCNGAESCDPVAGCRAGTDPCAGGLCDEGLDQCDGVSATCDGKSTVGMADGSHIDCAPYRCAAGACKASCENDNDCVSDTVCTDSSCIEPKAGGGSCNTLAVGAGTNQVKGFDFVWRLLTLLIELPITV